MVSLVVCAGCGKKPRIKANASRRAWGGEVRSPQGTSKAVLSPPKRGQASQAYWAAKHAAEQAGHSEFAWDASPAHRSIFDKLTDPSLYTGSHKHRFDEDGRGRGLEGRDSVAKGLGTGAVLSYYGDGPVLSIAQLVRNEKLDPGHMNKVRKFDDGTTILNPINRSLKAADGAWRTETPRGVYPHNNPTYQRMASPVASPRQLTAAQAAQLASGGAPPLSPGGSTLRLSRSQGQLNHHPHDINLITSQGRTVYGGDFRQEGSYAPQVVGPLSPRGQQQLMQQQQQQQRRPGSASRHKQQSPSQFSQPQRPQTAAYIGSPIFDKLTDPSLYTGSHRHRFDESGHGRGLAGRVEVAPERYQGDAYASADVKDLSQITRQNFNVGSPQGKIGKTYHY